MSKSRFSRSPDRIGSRPKARFAAALAGAFAATLLVAAAVDARQAGKPITNYLGFVGGTAGAANPKSAPIEIGWINMQGGPISAFPAATAAAQAAVKYVNAKLGGVGGHPVRLKTCFIVQSEEEGQKCAQVMMNDNGVNVILFGLVAAGSQSIFSTVGGKKPIIVGSPADPSAEKAKNTYALSGTELAVFAPWATFAVKKLAAHDVAVIYPNIAGAIQGADAIKVALKKAGAKVTSVGYEPTLNDLLGPITAAGGQKADAIVPVADGPNCVKIAKALQQIGSHVAVISVPNCLDPQVMKAFGDFPQWYYGIAASIATDLTAPDVRAYHNVSKAYGLTFGESLDPFAQLAWGQVLLSVKLMNQIGPTHLTAAALGKAMARYKGSYPMGPPTLACGSSPPTQPASCNDRTQFYLYQGKGKFKLAAAWLPGPS